MFLAIESIQTTLAVYLQCVILGLIQGLTEFLPVSSSAHLLLLPLFGGTPYLGKSVDVALHGGTLLSVLWLLGPELRIMATGLWRKVVSAGQYSLQAGLEQLGPWLLLATIPTAVIGFCLENSIEAYFSVGFMAGALALFALLLWAADAYSGRSTELAALRWPQALLLGFMQALAFFPGVSRSGITLTAGRLLGLAKEDAVKVSFLCSVPVIGGAVLVKLAKGLEVPEPALYGPILLGVAVAALSGAWGIRLVQWISRRWSFAGFALYRVILALALLCFYYF